MPKTAPAVNYSIPKKRYEGFAIMSGNTAVERTRICPRVLKWPVAGIILMLNTMFMTNAIALDPPANIRLEGADLRWDAVSDANEYFVYYFDGPIPSSTVLGNYLTNTGDTVLSLDQVNAPFGFYTIVSVQISGETIVDFSRVTDGDIVAFPDPADTTDIDPTPTINLALLSTGQQDSFFPGDDGDNQAGVPVNTEQRYVVNNDGTFTDTLTQLVWIADSECIPLLNWVDAVDFANGLTGDGAGGCSALQDGSAMRDWRLANIIELQSLYNYGPVGVAILDVPVTSLDIVQNQFWSSTSFGSTPSPNDTGFAWEMEYLPVGDTGSHVEIKENLGRAWSVRDQ